MTDQNPPQIETSFLMTAPTYQDWYQTGSSETISINRITEEVYTVIPE